MSYTGGSWGCSQHTIGPFRSHDLFPMSHGQLIECDGVLQHMSSGRPTGAGFPIGKIISNEFQPRPALGLREPQLRLMSYDKGGRRTRAPGIGAGWIDALRTVAGSELRKLS